MLGAMRLMAVQAVFPNGRVLPKERPSLLGVAGITVLVDGILDQELGARAPVRIVAIGAGHLSFPQGHVGGPHVLSLP